MLVGENVIGAEAVVACAAGTIAELQIGIVGVGAAAHGALVAIAPLGFLFLLLAHGGLEVDGLPGGPVADPTGAVGDDVVEIRPEKDQEVHQRHHRQQRVDEVKAQQGEEDLQDEPDGVNGGDPLDLDGEDEKDHLHIGIEGGEGQEHGHGYIARAVDAGVAESIVADDAGEDGQRHAGEIIEVELGGAPFPLEKIADEVAEVQRQQQPQRTCGSGDEDEGHKTPDLTPQDHSPVKRQKRDGAVRGELQQQIYKSGTENDVAHQTRNAETGMQAGKTLHRVMQFFHLEDPSDCMDDATIIPKGAGKVMYKF